MNLDSILCKTSEAIKKVGSFILAESGKIKNEQIETKSLNSLVTFVDKTAEMMLVKSLKEIIPESVFITEENTITQENGIFQWIIDPLDGTTNFISGIPIFSISIALRKYDEIIMGIVYEINRDELFSAILNQGAYLNGKKIHISTNNELANSLIATGFPYYDFKNLDTYMGTLKFLMQNTRGVRRLGSAAVDLCYTACGRFDAFFEYSLSPWDIAAGGLIVSEAGGSVSDFSGGNQWLFGKEIIAGNPAIMKPILEKLNT
jgi:myo-inositol-1(or 4)-monophosphatase